jgi:cyclopropane-fatty-acyl-phospholipid synthase
MLFKSKAFIEKLVSAADVKINGDRPWDIQVHNEKFYGRVMSQGTLGLGESYMDGWWDAEQLDEFFNKVLGAGLDKKIRVSVPMLFNYLRGKIFNAQKLYAFHIGEHHYDIGNDLYEIMLDESMAYSCGYWKKATTLKEAQEAKFDLVCRKLNLEKGQKILDIGSGWGGFMQFAAQKYGVSCIGITVSKEQVKYANKISKNLPVETRLQDYRDITGRFDHIVSFGMFEHVGYKNYRAFMKKVNSILKDNGLFLLHTIGNNISVVFVDSWMGKYIFPNSMLPSIKRIAESIEGLFVMEDWHNFGADYDTTLMNWYGNFNAGWDRLRDKYGDRFYRMWKYYLLLSAGSFRSRKNQLWQIVLSKKGVSKGYVSIR